MIATRKQTRRKISDLKMDFEVMNPIESKKVLGGDWYNDWDLGWLNEVVITGGGGGGWYDPFGVNYNDGSSWGDQGGGYYGGGGGNPDNGPTFPDHICTQLNQGTTCATMALSYVANYFGATGLTSSDFAEMTGHNYMSMMVGLQDGLTGAQLSTIMSTIFNSTTIDGSTASMESNLNSGNPILATINQGGGIGHEVVIVGFDANVGTVSYMDSLVGSLVTSNVNTVNFIGSLYAVTGVQNNATVNQYKNDTNDVKCSICGH